MTRARARALAREQAEHVAAAWSDFNQAMRQAEREREEDRGDSGKVVETMNQGKGVQRV